MPYQDSKLYSSAHHRIDRLFGSTPVSSMARTKRLLDHATARMESYLEGLPPEFRPPVQAGIQAALAEKIDELVKASIDITG